MDDRILKLSGTTFKQHQELLLTSIRLYIFKLNTLLNWSPTSYKP